MSPAPTDTYRRDSDAIWRLVTAARRAYGDMQSVMTEDLEGALFVALAPWHDGIARPASEVGAAAARCAALEAGLRELLVARREHAEAAARERQLAALEPHGSPLYVSSLLAQHDAEHRRAIASVAAEALLQVAEPTPEDDSYPENEVTNG